MYLLSGFLKVGYLLSKREFRVLKVMLVFLLLFYYFFFFLSMSYEMGNTVNPLMLGKLMLWY